MAVEKAKLPFVLRERLSPALFWRTTVPARPVTVPPTVNLFVVQLAAALARAPRPLVTAQDCRGLAGWVRTLTLYAAPLASFVANVKMPLEVTVRLSPALFWRTSPVPTRPLTVPPTVCVARFASGASG